MNIEELKQVSEMLATLSGQAFDGYLLWIGKEYLEMVLSWALWVTFWVLFFKFVMRIINVFVDQCEKDRGIDESRKELNKLLSDIDTRLNRKGIYTDRTPSGIVDVVSGLIEKVERKQ